MRIYIGNGEIAGYFYRLKKGFDELGVKADFWPFYDNKFNYEESTNLLVDIFRWTRKQILKKKFCILPFKPFLFLISFASRIISLIYILSKYDVFILNHFTVFKLHELPVLKLFRKKIIYVFLGTESRPIYISGNVVLSKFYTNDKPDTLSCYKETKKKYHRLKKMEKYADIIINHPPSSLFHSKPFVAWLHIGYPFNIVNSINNNTENNECVKILHAPSLSLSKGTSKIIEIISRIRIWEIKIELIKLENVENKAAIEEIKKCDFVVDELYSDIPLGALGAEASFVGKAVINSGYYHKHIYKDYPPHVIPPSIYCHPDDLGNKITELAINKDLRENIALSTKKFVMKNWTSREVAKRFLMLINNEAPPEWYFDPYKITYIYGYGISKEKSYEFLKSYISDLGEKALFLDDKLILKRKLIDFAFSK